MRRFTNSELTTWKTCRRQWWLAYYRRLGPIREETVSAASLGTLVHLGLEAHYNGEDALAAMEIRMLADREAVMDLVDVEKLKKFDKQCVLAKTMVEGYIEWCEETGTDSDLEFIGAERAVEVELMPGVTLLSKLDAKFRRRSTGVELFMDHKTVASIEQTEEAAYRSSQFRTYALVEYLESLSTGAPAQTSGVLLNMLRKVGRSATAKPPFYGREEFSFNTELLRNHWQQVMAEIERVLTVEEALDRGHSHHTLVPPSPSRDCSWRCPFKSVCPMFDDGSDAEGVLSAFFAERDPLARYGEDAENEDAA